MAELAQEMDMRRQWDASRHPYTPEAPVLPDVDGAPTGATLQPGEEQSARSAYASQTAQQGTMGSLAQQGLNAAASSSAGGAIAARTFDRLQNAEGVGDAAGAVVEAAAGVARLGLRAGAFWATRALWATIITPLITVPFLNIDALQAAFSGDPAARFTFQQVIELLVYDLIALGVVLLIAVLVVILVLAFTNPCLLLQLSGNSFLNAIGVVLEKHCPDVANTIVNIAH